MTARPDVVALWLDIDDIDTMVTARATPRRKSTGDLFTDDEMSLILSATRDDLESVRSLIRAQQEYHERQLFDSMRFVALVEPYFLAGAQTLGDVRDVMTPEDAEQFDRLAESLFPDGWMHLGPNARL